MCVHDVRAVWLPMREKRKKKTLHDGRAGHLALAELVEVELARLLVHRTIPGMRSCQYATPMGVKAIDTEKNVSGGFQGRVF